MPKDNEGSETTDEEVITTPEQAAAVDNDDESEEKETPAASSADDETPADDTEDDESEDDDESKDEDESPKPDDESEDDEEDESGTAGDKSQDLSDGTDKGSKRLPDETPKEYALRLEVSRLKGINRKQRSAKLLGDVQPQKDGAPAELSEEDKQILEAFDPEQLGNLEKAFTVLAKKQGYVKKDELTVGQYKETAQSVLDSWLETHPEYSEDKDPDGILWKQFGQEFSLYKPPANPKDHVKIFNRIHNDIFGITTKDKAAKDLNKIKAKQEKAKTASAGSSSSTPRRLSDKRQSSPADKELSSAARGGGLVGFDDKELADMGL